MPEWQLAFPITTLDDRITMRAAIARLQVDPHHVRTVLTERRDRYWIYRVEFEGEPEDPEVLRLRESYQHYDYASWDRAVNGPNSNGDVIDPEVARQVLQNYLATPPERRNFGPSLAPPIRTRRDYVGTARRTFIVDELPQGALPVYDRDPDPGTTPRTLETGVESFENIIREGLGLNRQAPYTFPSWVRPDVWVRLKSDPEKYARIVEVQNGQAESEARARIANWRRNPETEWVAGVTFVALWEQTERPREPLLTRFDRVDLDVVPEPEKTAEVTIQGKPGSFLVKWKQAFQRFFSPQGDTILANPPEVEWTDSTASRFERLDRDE